MEITRHTLKIYCGKKRFLRTDDRTVDAKYRVSTFWNTASFPPDYFPPD